MNVGWPAGAAAGERGLAATHDDLPFAGLTILVVDDTEDSLDATSIMLEVLGATVLAARNGLEALDVMRANHPDLAW